MMKILVNVIHNHELDRMQSLNETLNLIRKTFDEINLQGQQIEYKIQFYDIKNSCHISRTRVSYSLILELRIYMVSSFIRNGFSIATIRSVWEYLKQTLKNIITYQPSKHYSTIDLTTRHLKGWKYFLDSNANYLITMESDVIIKSDSAYRFRRIFMDETFKMRDNFYFDLAGGFEINVILGKVYSETISQFLEFRSFEHNFVNTTCCYLVDKVFLQNCYDFLLKRNLSIVAIDSILNDYLHSSMGYKSTVYHSEPPIFQHGSRSGENSSTIV